MGPFPFLQGRAGHVQFQVIVGLIQRLPDAIQIRMLTVRTAWRLVGLCHDKRRDEQRDESEGRDGHHLKTAHMFP